MSEETVPTPDKMKVTELRKALSDRGLNPKGTKAVLVKQLFAAMQSEEGSNDQKKEDSTEDEEAKNKEEEKVNEKDEEEKKKEDEEKKKSEDEKVAEEKEKEEKITAENKKMEEKLAEEKKKEEVKSAEEKKKQEEKLVEEKKKQEEKLAEEKKKEEEKLAEDKKKEEEKLSEENKKKDEEKLLEEKKKLEENETEEKKMEEKDVAGDQEMAVEIDAEKSKKDADMETNEIEPEKSKNSTESKTQEEIKVDNKCGVKYTKVVRTVYVRQKDDDQKEEVSAEAKRGGTKRKMDEEENQEPNMKKRKVEKDEKDDEKKEETETKEEVFEVVEVEPEIDENFMCLDWYNSDLNLKIGDDKISGQPEHKKGFGYAYAGARATHGFNSGKVWYEVKFEEALDCSLEKEGNRHDLRVGWSTDDASLQLGESELSWCYVGATGKMANNSLFEEYGEKIEKGDIIGAYVDFEKESVGLSFTRNGEDLGEAYQIPKGSLGGRALFPHILSKNVKFEVNFGSVEPWKEALDIEYLQATKEDHKIRGKPRIQKREDCELIMMVGLPASGKTTWVNKFIKENPYKNYNILGTNAMLDKMTVEGKPRKEVHEGKWENLMRVVTNCNQDMIEFASKRRRNFIIDQTNVYVNAQKKKSQPFVGLKRRAVVVVTTSKEHNERIKLQEEQGKKNFPNGIIEELKANLTLPTEKDSWFAEITFAELQREEAEKVVELDRKVAKEKGYGKKKEQRFKKNLGKGPVKGQKNVRTTTGQKNVRASTGQKNVRSSAGQRGQIQRRGGNRNGGQVMRPHNFRGQQNMGGSPMWNNYWQDKHHNNLRNMAQAAGWVGNRGNMGMPGRPNMGAWGNMGGQGNVGAQRNMGGQGNMGAQRNMGGQGNMGGQWRSGGFNQGGMQPNPFSQSWSQGSGWRR